MVRSEVALLLGICASFDRRTVGQFDVESWHSVLSDLDFEPCRQAVLDHFADSNDWIMPADIRNGALQRGVTFTPRTPALPAADPDDVPAYLADLRAGRGVEIEPGPGIEPRRLSNVLKSLKENA